MKTISVLDHGLVRLDASCADDLSVVNAARVSLHKRHEAMEEGDDKLISFLMTNRHGCFDSDTEVLTRVGWVKWPDVSGQEEFITLSDTESIEYQRAERVVHKPVCGPMIRVEMDNADLLVTPDHRVLSKRRAQPNREVWRLTPAKDLLSASHRMRMGGGTWEGQETNPDRMKLLGFFIGDGNFTGTSIEFHLRRKRKIAYLAENAAAAGFEVRGTEDCYRLIADASFRELAKQCYAKDESKIIPLQILSAGRAALSALMDGLLNSDGSVSETGRTTFYSTSAALAGQVQEVALKTGVAATINDHPFTSDDGHFGSKPRYRVTVYKSRNMTPRIGWTQEARKSQVRLVHYEGDVHCVTVPNGTLYVRRNGIPLWCGNTPFEHNFFRFHVKAPIFVFREWHRHRIGISINEWSARYSQLEPEFYVPENVRSQTGKPGHYTYEAAEDEDAETFRRMVRMQYQRAFDTYRVALDSGIAKEQARLVLPVAIYSEMYWSCNARSLMAFLSLRNAPQAQWEIRQYAQALESVFCQVMPITAEAFIGRGRVAP